MFSRAFARSSARTRANFPGPSASVLRNIRTYGYAISGITSLTVGFGLKTASSVEQARVAFTTMLGSAQQAKAMVADLADFAKNTPFQFTDVVSATQRLLAYGFAAKDVLPTLTAIGDASAGLSLGADGIDRITVALGQIAAKGRVQSQELLQLTEAGIQAPKILANQFGITTAALSSYVEKGLIPASKAIPALLDGIEHGTRGIAGSTTAFGGLMAKQSKTLGGIFSNLKDTVSLGLARAVKPLVPVLKEEIPRAMSALPGVFRAVSRSLGEFLHGLGVASDKTPGIATKFERLGGAIRFTARFSRNHARDIATIAGAYVAYRSAVRGAAIMQGIFNAVLTGSPMGRIARVVLILGTALTIAAEHSKGFRNVLKKTAVIVATAFGYLAGFVNRALKFMLDGLLRFASDSLNIADKAFGWIPKVGPKLDDAKKAFEVFRANVDTTLSGMISDAEGTGDALAAIFAGAAVQAKTAWNAITGSEAHGDQFAFRAATAAGNRANTTTNPLKLGLGIGDDLTKGLKDSTAKVGKSASELIDKILGPLRDLQAKAKQLAQSITQAITGSTGFGALGDQTDSLGASFGQSVKSIISSFVNQKREVIRFRHELRLLEKRGLSDASIQEIAGLGLEQGGGIAATLMDASRKQLRRLSRLRGDSNQAAVGIGRDVAGNRFGAQISRELVQTRRAIEKASHNTDLSDRTVRRLRNAYKDAAQSVRPYVNVVTIDRVEGKRVRQQ